jgi:hypothetical protein
MPMVELPMWRRMNGAEKEGSHCLNGWVEESNPTLKNRQKLNRRLEMGKGAIPNP